MRCLHAIEMKTSKCQYFQEFIHKMGCVCPCIFKEICPERKKMMFTYGFVFFQLMIMATANCSPKLGMLVV